MLEDYSIVKLSNSNYLDFSRLKTDNLYSGESTVEYKFDSYITNLEDFNSNVMEQKYINNHQKNVERKNRCKKKSL